MEFQNIEQMENALAAANAQIQFLLRLREQEEGILAEMTMNMLAYFYGMVTNNIEAIHRRDMENIDRAQERAMRQLRNLADALNATVGNQRRTLDDFNQLLLGIQAPGHVAARAGPNPAAQVAHPAVGAQVAGGGQGRRRRRRVADAAAGQRRGIPNEDVVYKQRVIGKGQDFDPATGIFTSFVCTAENCHVTTNTSRDLRMHFRNSHEEQ